MEFFFEITSSESEDSTKYKEPNNDISNSSKGAVDFHFAKSTKETALHWIILMYAIHIPFIFFLNAAVMIIVILVRKFHTSDNYILFGMAFVDFMCGFANMLVIAEVDHDLFRLLRGTKAACIARLSFNAFWYNNSLTLMMVMCIERNLAIMHPFWYHVHVSGATVIKSILAVMTMEFVYSCVMLVFLMNYDVSEPNLVVRCQRSDNTPKWYGHYLKFTKLGLQLILTVFLSLRVYIVALKQLRSNNQTGSHLIGYTDDQAEHQIKQVKLMMVLIVVFVLLYIPIMVNPIVTNTQSSYFSEVYRASSRHLLYLNSSVNPVIYAFRKSSFRKAYRFLLTSRPRNWRKLSAFIAQHQNAHTDTKEVNKTNTTRKLTTGGYYPTAKYNSSSSRGTVPNYMTQGLETLRENSCSTIASGTASIEFIH